MARHLMPTAAAVLAEAVAVAVAVAAALAQAVVETQHTTVAVAASHASSHEAVMVAGVSAPVPRLAAWQVASLRTASPASRSAAYADDARRSGLVARSQTARAQSGRWSSVRQSLAGGLLAAAHPIQRTVTR